MQIDLNLCAVRDLNPRPFRCKRIALPTELTAQYCIITVPQIIDKINKLTILDYFDLIFKTKLSMKTLVLMRHAGYNPATGELAEEGIADLNEITIPLLQKTLANNKHVLELVVCSPSIRTAHTAGLVAKAFGLSPEKVLRREDLILEASDAYMNDLVNELRYRDEKVILVVTHEPIAVFLGKIISGKKFEYKMYGDFHVFDFE